MNSFFGGENLGKHEKMILISRAFNVFEKPILISEGSDFRGAISKKKCHF